MFTSRAEYRILLRQDNADIRLTEIGHKIGLANKQRLDNVLAKIEGQDRLTQELTTLKLAPDEINAGLTDLNTSLVREKLSVINLLKRPEIGMSQLETLSKSVRNITVNYTNDQKEQVEIQMKYDSYIDREQKLVAKIGALDSYRINPDFDYDRVKALSHEAREKLKKIKPETLGQATRISGVSPADVSVLTIYMGK
jgi:tRNA uridine 5-carboxymethylaminomethyl modification enzyme